MALFLLSANLGWIRGQFNFYRTFVTLPIISPLSSPSTKYLNIQIIIDFNFNRLIIPKPSIIPCCIPANLHVSRDFLIQELVEGQQDNITLLVIL